jgi:hypothetical protein
MLCIHCGESDLSMFYKSTGKRNICSNCYIKKGIERNKLGKIRNEMKKKERGNCLKCGLIVTDTNYHHFEWDHRDPLKKIKEVSKMLQSPNKKIEEEISKCDLLCLFCHRDRTITQALNNSRPKNSLNKQTYCAI